MEMNYIQVGDYFIPDLQLNCTHDKSLGKYGRMHRAFLEEHNPVLMDDLILTEKLFPYLWEIQKTCETRMEVLMKQLVEKNPPPDKATQQLAWVQHMNMLKAQAEECVLTEIVYSL